MNDMKYATLAFMGFYILSGMAISIGAISSGFVFTGLICFTYLWVIGVLCASSVYNDNLQERKCNGSTCI